MSNSAVIPIRRSPGAISTHAGVVTRTPFYFESQHQWLFAWLHRPEHILHSDHAVLICPPIGHEQIHAHRSLRHLADAVAAAGFPVMRFDYHGTGDSSGFDEDPERVATWLANVRDARRWLIEQLGCMKINAIGLRLGAMLAAQAITDQPIENLLLWVPVVKGRSYVREMKALNFSKAGSVPTSSATAGDIEAAGFVLTEQTLQDLSCLDLLQIHPLCRRALIVQRDDTPTDLHLLEHFKSLGIETQQMAQPGYADMMLDPLFGKVPGQVITHVVDWLLAQTAASDNLHQPRDGNQMGSSRVPRDAFLSQQRIRERVLPISEQPNLFGILSGPADGTPKPLPFVVMLNTGSTYRVGPHRFYVSLARQLAAKGFSCLRMDICGLGDSITPYQERENDPYPATAFFDIDRTLECLHTQFGVQRVVLLGVCSGAYAAFQAAAQLSSPHLIESVLINPATFHWSEDLSLTWESSPAVQIQWIQHYFAAVWQPAKWLKLLTGRSTLGIGGAVNLFVQRWKLKKHSCPKSPLDGVETENGPPSHPHRKDLPGDLQRIAEANRHLACFFARADPGYDILTFYARRKLKELRRTGRMEVHFIDGADHTFSRRAPRQALIEAIAEHLCRRYRSEH